MASAFTGSEVPEEQEASKPLAPEHEIEPGFGSVGSGILSDMASAFTGSEATPA